MTSRRDTPHRRYNPLNGQWVLVSAQRAKRPWQGAVEQAGVGAALAHDPQCYLCAGNPRSNGQTNPLYSGTYVFANDYPALLEQAAEQAAAHAAAPAGQTSWAEEVTGGAAADKSMAQYQAFYQAFFHTQAVEGVCRVLCFSPDHSKTLAQLPLDAVQAVVAAWAAQVLELGATYPWVQVFENKGAQMGCSNPHPHGQIWATSYLPHEVALEDACQREHTQRSASNLLLAYAAAELRAQERVVVQTEYWVAVVPFWASWPFETLLLPQFPVHQLYQLDTAQQKDLALALHQLTVKYDNVFACPFPYSMGWHGAPHHQLDQAHWQLHAHFYPPLLRSATVRKYMVGFEMLAEAQRDMSPEQAAAILRAQPRTHYTHAP